MENGKREEMGTASSFEAQTTRFDSCNDKRKLLK